MADKRTTPEASETAPQATPQDAAQGSRRKKRAAPTIDLTATEMPSPEPASPSQPDPSPAAGQEPPPELAKDAPPVTGGTVRGGAFGLATLAAGIAGAAAIMLVMLALWLTGLLPVRYQTATNAQAPADTKAVDALTHRVSRIEDAIKKLPTGDTGVTERLTAAENAMKALGIALTALNRRSDDITANTSQARERADAAAKAVAELQASMNASGVTGTSGADIDILKERIAALERETQAARADLTKIASKSSGTDNAARLALSAAVMRDAVLSGAPFADVFAAVKQLGGEDKTLAPLASFAASGVPTAQTLAQELRAQLPAILKISGAQAPEGGFLDRLAANAAQLVRIRPINAPPGDDPSAVLARLEIDAAKADIAAALANLGKLPDAARAPAQAWIERAKARQAALAAARQYAADAARALGPK